jgi:hypothetical protein
MSIPAGGYVIIANTPQPFSLPNNEGLLINANYNMPEFNISDAETVNIDLIINNEVIDTFFVLANWVTSRDDYMESFHKVLLLS